MTRTPDYGWLGFLPLQDHREENEPPVDRRNVVYAVRFEGYTEDDLPRPVPGTAGDLTGATVWEVEEGERQDLAAWSFAMGAMVTEVRDEDGTSTEDWDVKLRPVRNDDWEEDDRFKEMEVRLPEGTKGRKGQFGLVVNALQENEQQPLFFPADSPLIAVHLAGDPDKATPVYRLNTQDELDEWAPLHSLMRVVTPEVGCALPNGPSLALQYGKARQDNRSGDGLVSDGGGGLVPDTKGPADGEEPEEPPPTEKPQPQPEDPDGFQVGRVTTIFDYIKDLADRLSGEEDDPTRTRTRDGEGSQPPEPSDQPPPPGATGLDILASMSSRLNGPIHVGEQGDQHRLFTTADGEAGHTAHLNPGAPWYLNKDHDAPLEFTEDGWEDAPEMPFTARARIAYSEETHPWVCGPRKGMFKLMSEAFFLVIEDDDDPPPPPPPSEDEDILFPSPLGGSLPGSPSGLEGFIDGVRPGGAGVDIVVPGWMIGAPPGVPFIPNPDDQEPDDEEGEPTVGEDGGPCSPPYVSTPRCVATPGVVIRGGNTTKQAPDLTTTGRKGFKKGHVKKALKDQPAIAKLSGTAPVKNGHVELTSGRTKTKEPTADGSANFLPGDLTLREYFDGVSSGVTTYVNVVRDAVKFALAAIDEKTGLPKDGMVIEVEEDAKLTHTVVDASQNETKAKHDYSSLTADREYTWPDKDGTVAMTDDVATATITPGDGISGDGSAGDPVTIDPDGVSNDGDTVAVSSDGLAIDGDLLEVSSHTPSNSTPDTTGTDATRTSQLAAILQGIDDALASASGVPVDDTTLLVQDPGDNTKRAGLDAGDVPSGSDVRLKVPDADLESIIVSALADLQSIERSDATDGAVSEALRVQGQPSGGYSSNGSGLSLDIRRADNGELWAGIQGVLNDSLGRYSDVRVIRRQGSSEVESARFGSGSSFGGLRQKDGIRIEESASTPPAQTATESGYTTLAAYDNERGLRFQQDNGNEQKVLGAEEGATDIAFDQNDGRRQDHYEKTTDSGFSGSSHTVNNVFTAKRFNRGPAVEVTTELDLSGSPTAVEVGDGSDQNRYGSFAVSGGKVAAGTKLDTEDATVDPREFSIAAGGVTFTPVGGTSPSFNSGAVSLIAVEETVAHV